MTEPKKELVFVVRVQLGDHGDRTGWEVTPERVGEAIDLMTYIGDEVRVTQVAPDEAIDRDLHWQTPGFRWDRGRGR